MFLLSYIHWGVSPEIIRLGPVSIRYYGLFFALGFIVGYQVLQWVFNSEKKSLKDLESLTISMILGTVIGARLGHCLFYEPSFYLSHPLEILYVWKGGLASHGAGIGNVIALLIYSRRHKDLSMLWVLDRVGIVVPFAAACVRFGNFFNSEILGKPADLPWSVVFTRVDPLFPNPIARHPVQLYEATAYLLIFITLILVYKHYKENAPKGLLSGLFLIFLFGARFIIEFFKEVQVPFEKQMSYDMGQLLSLPFILFGLVLLFMSLRKKPA